MHRLTLGLRVGWMDAGLLLLSIAGSVAYMAGRGWGPSPGGIVFKALGIAPLALLALRRAHGNLAAALTASSVGDVLLAIDRRRYFTPALTAFLLAHLAYTVLFVRSWPRPLRPGGRRVILAALVVLYSSLLMLWLLSELGPHTAPVTIYAGAITAMTVSAIFARAARPVVLIGALLFLLSDSLLAVARFKAGWMPAAYLIWPTYYLGQYAIAVGVLGAPAGDAEEM